MAMRNWYTTLLPTWPQGRHSRTSHLRLRGTNEDHTGLSHRFFLFTNRLHKATRVTFPAGAATGATGYVLLLPDSYIQVLGGVYGQHKGIGPRKWRTDPG